MKPVIKSVEGRSNPVLGPEDGVPNYVMLWVQHPPGGSSAQHVHPWEHQAYIVEGEGALWVEGEEYPIKGGRRGSGASRRGAPVQKQGRRNTEPSDGESA